MSEKIELIISGEGDGFKKLEASLKNLADANFAAGKLQSAAILKLAEAIRDSSAVLASSIDQVSFTLSENQYEEVEYVEEAGDENDE